LKVVQGDFATCVEGESRLADLVVFSDITSERVRDALETVLLSGARPVLFSAAEASEIAYGQHVAIAFDGSAAAAHAVTASLPFLKQAKSVHGFEVIASTKSSTALADLKQYLALHDVSVVTHSVDPARKSTQEALVAAVENKRCDMLVMGGYGHNRVREFVFGGVTRHVLRHPVAPAILMAH
jgi:nucleotide-binding universal stress UspA family protein